MLKETVGWIESRVLAIDLAMTNDSNSPLRGTGRRLITAAEAAAILRVSEQAVLDWIASGRISYVTLPSGEHRIRLVDEDHNRSGPTESGFAILQLHSSALGDQESRSFDRELWSKQQELRHAGLDYGDVDIDAFVALLADRLAAVAPDRASVSVRDRMILAAGWGSDVALAVGAGESLEERLVGAARNMLGTASDAFSQVTTDPWPARPGQFPSGFPPFDAKIADGELRLWYGEERAPILELSPIKLDELLQRPQSSECSES